MLTMSGSKSLVLLTLTTLLLCTVVQTRKKTQRHWQADQSYHGNHKKSAYRHAKIDRERQGRSTRPNIVFVLTDDQDYDLGSMNFMPKTLRLLRDEGAFFPNAYVTTPMCCPSRSSILTGLYAHNHHVFTNNDNCSNVEWQQTFEINNFGRYLSDSGYRTGYFGKYLNDYQGTYIPPGWTEWVALVRNTRYYNYSLNFNGEKIKHGDDYHKDYLTDLIANDSVTFLKQSKQYFPDRPVAMVLSMPAPHGPEDSAPQYQHLFKNITSYRTPSWNHAPNPDKQWLLQSTGKMEPIHMSFTDMLQQKRLQTLQSVDDAVEKVYLELKRLGELDNTYFLYSSDHGYHLGQFGLLKGKAMPYEFDIKVPFYLRGPKIPAGSRVQNIALNVDIAPTFLDIAGLETPDHMDGRSLLKLFEDNSVDDAGNLKKKKAWRDTFLVERGKVTSKKIKERERMEADKNSKHLQTKENRLVEECEKLEYKSPCSANQQWECRKRPDGMLRMYKCREKLLYKEAVSGVSEECDCPQPTSLQPSKEEKKQQKQFLYTHVNKPKKLKPKFIRSKVKRSMREEYKANLSERIKRQIYRNQGLQDVICKVIGEQVVCDDVVYKNSSSWQKQKTLLDDNIEKLKQQLDSLRDIKKHLRQKKPQVDVESSTQDTHTNVTSLQQKVTTETISTQRTLSTVSPSTQHTPSTVPPSTQQTPSTVPPSTQRTQDENHSDISSGGRSEETNRNQTEVKDTHTEVKDTETDYDDEIFTDTTEEYEFDPEDFQDESDKRETEECVCDVMLSDQLNDDEAKKVTRQKKRRDRKISNRLKKRQKFEERERKRQEKQELRTKFKKKSHDKNKGERKKQVDPTRDCSSGNMKCFEHTNGHWRTPPLWSKLSGSKGVFGARKDPACKKEGLECSRMDNTHWRVAPLWTLGPFCFCPNSNNNTYWCLRTINDTHNFQYCEFITGFISYYDFTQDPYQLRNAVRDLNYQTLTELHKLLEKLKSCKGARECTARTRPVDDRSSLYEVKKKKLAVSSQKDNRAHHARRSRLQVSSSPWQW